VRRSWEIINSFWFFVENGAWSAGGFSVDGDTVEDVSVVVAAILTFALEKEGGGAKVGIEVRASDPKRILRIGGFCYTILCGSVFLKGRAPSRCLTLPFVLIGWFVGCRR